MAILDLFKKQSPIEQAERLEPVVKEPINPSNDISATDIESFADALGITSQLASLVVTPTNSMKLSIVYACTRLISGAIAQMGKHVYQDKGNNKERIRRHPVSPLLNLQPTAIWSAATFWEWVMRTVLLAGDSVSVIMRNRNGDPLEILPIQRHNWMNEEKNGRLLYSVWLDGKVFGFDQDDILHFPGFGFDGLGSMSVIQWGAFNSIGLQLAMETFSKDFFENGANQKYAVIKNGKWDSDGQENFRSAWSKTYSGNAKRHIPMTISNGLDIKELSVNAKDSQLLESREFQITDIARAFGLPSFMVNQEQKSTSWGSGIAEISLGFVRYTMMPHVGRFEQEINRKLFLYSDHFVEFSAESLMRGTTKERYEQYRQAVGGAQGPGWITQNEIRRMENMPTIDNAHCDQLFNPTTTKESDHDGQD